MINRFIGETCNVNNDARILIPNFLKRYGFPSNHIIGTQLLVIAEEAQKAKNEKGREEEEEGGMVYFYK
jgi:hypothetical protein